MKENLGNCSLLFSSNEKAIMNIQNISTNKQTHKNTQIWKKQPNMNYRKEKTIINSFETVMEFVENDIFKTSNYRRIKSNISNQERNALKDIQKDTSKICHIQDKGSRFVALNSDDYNEKFDRQLERRSLQKFFSLQMNFTKR